MLGIQVGKVNLLEDEEVVEGESPYKADDDSQHYILVVTQPSDHELTALKTSIVDYNRAFHKLDRLTVFNIYMAANTDKPVIVIRKFKNKNAAMQYFQGVMELGDTFLPEDVTYEIFAISKANYRTFIKNKTIDSYKTFFESHYLLK